MPRTRIARRPVKEKERFFVNLYLKQGAQPEKIAACEKRACLKKGSGTKILRRKSVKEEIRAKTAPVLGEQMRQSILGDAAEIAERTIEEKLAEKIKLAKSLRIEKPVLDGILMEMVLGLDKHYHPKELLDAIKAAYIVGGAAESNSLRPVLPPEPQDPNHTNVYTALFNRLGAEKEKSSEKTISSPPAEPEAFDLLPPAPEAKAAPSTEEAAKAAEEQPAKPEKEPKPARKSSARVVTVQIE